VQFVTATASHPNANRPIQALPRITELPYHPSRASATAYSGPRATPGYEAGPLAPAVRGLAARSVALVVLPAGLARSVLTLARQLTEMRPSFFAQRRVRGVSAGLFLVPAWSSPAADRRRSNTISPPCALRVGQVHV